MTKITLPAERRVGHLKLLRRQRELTPAEYNALPDADKLEIIRARHGKDKADLILNSENAARLVPQLHPQEIYLTINRIGAEDTVELLELSSPEQINLLLDLDCWDGDTLSPVLSLHWLELLLRGSEDKLVELVRRLEPELFALFLKKHLHIRRGIEVFDDDDIETAKRIESLYDIEYGSENAAKIIGAVLKVWLEQDQESYLLIMEMIRSEQLSTLEEDVFQARNNRLLDLGLIPANEAQALYGYCEPDKFVPGGKTDFHLEAEHLQHPGALLAQAEPYNLLADILATGLTHDAACELLLLINRKISADGTDLSDPQQVGQAIQSTYDTLNLALEFLAGKDGAEAETVFSTTYLIRLFQLGHSLLKRHVDRAKRLTAGRAYPFFDYPEMLFVDSLLEKPACFYRTGNEDTPGHLQQIRTLKDLNLIASRLDQVETLSRYFTYDFPLPDRDGLADPDALPTLAQLFITALANQLLNGRFQPQPLPSGQLRELPALTMDGRQPSPSFRRQVHDVINRRAPHCTFFAEFCLDLWLDGMRGLTAEPEENFAPAFIMQASE